MSPRRLDPVRSSQKQTRREILQVLALVPLLIGGLLLLTAFTGAIVWGTTEQQVAMGVFYILFSFAASNAIQREWRLMLGWLLLGAAIWLFISISDSVVRVGAAVLIATSTGIVAREFLRRRRQYLDSQTH